MQKETEQPHAHLKWFGIPAVFPFIRPHKKLLLAVIISMALSSAIDAIFPLFQNYAITHYIGSGTLDTLPAFATSYLLLLLFQLCTIQFHLYKCHIKGDQVITFFYIVPL